LRQRQPRRDIGENHAHPAADANPLDFGFRREYPVGPHQIADHAEPLFLGRHAALSVQLDQQYEIWRVLLESRLNGMMDFGVGMHGAAPLDRHPFRNQFRTPGARRCRWVAKQLARGAALQAEIMLRTVGEVGEVLMVEIIDLKRHAEILR
jgi:hypothetical protein